MSGLVVAAFPQAAEGAGGNVQYAYAGGLLSSGPCPETATQADQCSLQAALNEAAPGDTIDLATPANEADYSGGFTISTSGTSAGSPVTIQPAPGVTGPILDGGHSHTALTVGDLYLDLNGVTIQDGYGNQGQGTLGGGIYNSAGGTVTVTNSTFSDDTTGSFGDGGAIDNGDGPGHSGTLIVTDSTFSDSGGSSAGGAIDNGDNRGNGTLTVTDSTFSDNNAGEGGAIDNGDDGGTGHLTVADSTFFDNNAGEGGAIDNGDNRYNGGTGDLTVTDSTFSSNSASSGPDIDNGDNSGVGIATVGANIFTDSCDQANQGSGSSWTDEGYNVGSDTSCFNSGTGDDDSAGSNLPSLLGPLQDNGGPTDTMLPVTGNPAIGIVPSTVTDFCPVTDQRGVTTGTGFGCDAGSVQSVNTAPPTLSSGPYTVGTAVSVTTGTWSSPDTLGFSYLWSECTGPDGTGCSEATGAGASTSTYTPDAADVGAYLAVTVTATDQENQAGSVTVSTASTVSRGGPSVVVVAPGSGTVAGGDPITITGTGFAPGASVLIGQGHGAAVGAIPATDVVVVSPTQITAVTGAATKAGRFNVFVRQPGATSHASTADLFTYTGPTVTGVNPPSGSMTGGTPITISGTGFVAGATVVIGQGHGAAAGAIPATDVTVVSSTEITAITAAATKTGEHNLFVSELGRTSHANTGDLFTYTH